MCCKSEADPNTGIFPFQMCDIPAVAWSVLLELHHESEEHGGSLTYEDIMSLADGVPTEHHIERAMAFLSTRGLATAATGKRQRLVRITPLGTELMNDRKGA